MKIKYPKKINNNLIKSFFINISMKNLINDSKRRTLGVNEKMKKQRLPYKADLNDLYRLYKFITLNKRLCVLEFGCGNSSIIINKALDFNKKNFFKGVEKIRQHNKFKHFSVDNDKNYLRLIKKKIPKNNISKFLFSKNKLVNVGYQISNEYESIPNINPDLIYIDGPDLFKIYGNKNGFMFNHPDRMPMSSDLLKIENFLVPGTIILMDGRTSNARFLYNNFKRKWIYKHDKINDQNIFILNEKPLGKYNQFQLKYYNF